MFKSHTSKIVLASIIVVASIGIVTGLFVTGIVSIGPNCLGVSGTSRTFTIIASSTGYNDSETIAGLKAWPIVSASRCDNLTFKITNVESTESHGFAIGSYQKEVVVAPGQTVSFSFVAVKTGQFRMYCTVLCLPHDYMQNGELNIT